MVNRQALRDQLAQLSIRIRAVEKTAEKAKAAADHNRWLAANKTVKRLRKEREQIIKRLGNR